MVSTLGAIRSTIANKPQTVGLEFELQMIEESIAII